MPDAVYACGRLKRTSDKILWWKQKRWWYEWIIHSIIKLFWWAMSAEKYGRTTEDPFS